MRLTLRTMLAYLDDLLEPADAEEIGERIRDSESASSLASRICDITRRLRLGTPRVSGRGGGVNPNTVAEYLDNTLSTERVPEFEKSCLESDVQLAEVASCHQVLTLVLGEPADVTPDCRQRMYKLLGSRRVAIDASHGAQDKGAQDKGAPDETATVDAGKKKKKKRRKRSKVPDYLREEDEPTTRRWPLFTFMALAATVTIVAMVVMNGSPGDNNTEMADAADNAPVADAPSPDADAPSEPNTPDNTAAVDPASVDPAPVAPTPVDTPPVDPVSADPATSDPSPLPPVPATIDDRPPPPPVDDPAAGPDDTVADSGDPLGDNVDGGDTEGGDVGGGDVERSEATEDGDTTPAGATLAQPDSIAGRFRPSEPGTLPADPGDMPAEEEPAPSEDTQPAPLAATDDPGADDGNPLDDPLDGDPESSDPLADDSPAAAPAPVAALGLGRFISNDSELLRYDAAEFAWQRVADRRMLQAGDQLLSLPVFRPFLTFSDVSVQLVGATHIRILPADADQTIGLEADHGRMVLMSSGLAGASIRLRVDEDEVKITFDDADATVAVEVVPRLDPGTDPAEAPLTRAAHLFVVSGTVSVSSDAGETQSLDALSRFAITPAAVDEAAASDELPDWINSDAYIKPLDHSAAQQIHETLGEDVPLRRSLRELAQHRRVEIRSLAARQMTYLDEFDAVVSALDNEQQRASWSAHFDTLRHAVARGQGSSQKVMLALEKRHGSDAAELHRMLWGYTKEQLTDGRAAQLVGFLDHEELSFRVLGFLNLEEITGKGGGYQPQQNALRRRRAVSGWRKEYEAGDIVPFEEAEEEAANEEAAEEDTVTADTPVDDTEAADDES